MHDPHPLPGTDVIIDGVRLHAVDHGRGDSAPIVFLRGPFSSPALWRDVVRDLEHDHRCLLPDLVGLGRSESPADRGAYPLAAQAQRVLGLLDAWHIDGFTVAGHDLGGAVAVHLAALAPHRVQGLALVSAPVHRELWPSPVALPYLSPGLRALLGRVGQLGRIGRIGRIGWGRPADRAHGLRAFCRAVDLVPTEATVALIRDVPALVLWGQRDEMLSAAYGRRVAAALPNAAWVPVNRAGHLLPQERPERVAEELHAFVSEQQTVQVADQ